MSDNTKQDLCTKINLNIVALELVNTSVHKGLGKSDSVLAAFDAYAESLINIFDAINELADLHNLIMVWNFQGPERAETEITFGRRTLNNRKVGKVERKRS